MGSRGSILACVVALSATAAVAAPCAQAHHPYAGIGNDRLEAHAADPQAASPSALNPLQGMNWSWNENPQVVRFQNQLDQAGRWQDLGLLKRITLETRFYWLGRHDPDPKRAVDSYLARARGVPFMRQGVGIVVYAHEGEECRRGYDGGGRAGERRYRSWMRKFAAAVGSSRVVIGLEPDSLGTMRCMTGAGRRARLRNLRFAVDLLSQLPRATVYIEAGASDWRPAKEMARYLRIVGVHKVRGFMLNVTHFDWTHNNVRYGARLSRMVGGKHFIVNTDENGRGPLRYWRGRNGHRVRINVWCNPRKSGLGLRPTLHTEHPKADAFLWISRPGASAGPCKGWNRRYSAVGPPAGVFWPQRALMLARNASW